MREFSVPLPDRMKALPVDKRGFPVPKFVAWFNGEPDFRVVDPEHMVACVNFNRCWICGQQMGRHKAFVIGPMCCVNRVNSEPPSHRECAEFAARACPFLSQPLAQRPDLERKPVQGETQPPAGIMLAHNPGASALWVTRAYRPFKVDNGILFDLGDPEDLVFYAKGRRATRAEVDAAVQKGLPKLQMMAEKDGKAAVKELQAKLDQFIRRLDLVLPRDMADVDLSSFAEAP